MEHWRVKALMGLSLLLGLLLMEGFYRYDNSKVYEKLYTGEYSLKVDKVEIVGQDTTYSVSLDIK